MLAHVVTRHFIIAAGASTAGMDALFTRQIPNKLIISLMRNEAFVSAWQKNPFNYTYLSLNSTSMVVDGYPLPSQSWQSDFMHGLYAETYHALLRPVAWTPVTGAMDCLLISSCCCPGTWQQWQCGLPIPQTSPHGKINLRFAKPLLATTTLIAYALVVVDAYHTVTFDYNAWCSVGNFRRPSWESPLWLGHWLVSTPGTNTGPCLHISRLPVWSTQLLGNTRWVFYLRTLGKPSTLIPMAPHHWSLSSKNCGAWAT